jgi:hypothetical protein
MPDKKDLYPAPVGRPPAGSYEPPNQQSIDLLIGLLQDYQRRSNQPTIPPEVDRDIRIVNAVVESIETALELGANKTTVGTINPDRGPSAGGTSVLITGTCFLPGTKVLFGGIPANSVTFVSRTEIRATTPPGTGRVEVLVSTLAGAVRRPDSFTYEGKY